MKAQKVVVVDYGLGNLYSVQRALEFCGVRNILFSNVVQDVMTADKLILPGVGAFEDGIKGLKEKNLIDPIINYANSGKSLLGICLGMQLLSSYSEEFGIHKGLNLIPGRVVPIPKEHEAGFKRKIPFIGWASLDEPQVGDWSDTPLDALNLNDSVYLVHSYYVKTDDHRNILATYNYKGFQVTAAIRSQNVYGFQFHPEKSGPCGLALLQKFLAID